MCICSNTTTPPDEEAIPCQVGNCPDPLNPVGPRVKNDDYEPSCGNKDNITPQYSVYCTTKAIHNVNESYCIGIDSNPPPSGWCNAEVLTTQEPKASSFTSQPTSDPPEKCPERRYKHCYYNFN